MASWRPPGSILEAPRLDLGEFWDQFFDILGLCAGEVQELISNSNLKLCKCGLELTFAFLSTSASKFGRDLPEGRVGGGVRPPGGFNGIGAKLAILASKN